MKDKLYKRRPIKWYCVISEIHDDLLYDNFISYCKSHPHMSFNRCAWNVLKSYYSTTTLGLIRQFGSFGAMKRVTSKEW